ncbi:hypothetical protein [Spiroplasma endosymbiont of Polydrusus formosus]|uniref:hypothetical protein n=1 Tax=Spiroplasma endosymbiont of Polydrusus formosus TaxID=3139326 RepID=UPI0035B500A7
MLIIVKIKLVVQLLIILLCQLSCQFSFFGYTFLSFDDHRLNLTKEFLQKDWWVILSYPFFYLMYVIVQAAAWTQDVNID